MKDHLGNIFESTNAMCRHYGISKNTYRHRIELGWTMEDALTQKAAKRRQGTVVDFDNNSFVSVAEMCRHYHIRKTTYQHRIELGWSVKDALTKDVQQNDTVDFLGNRYKSLDEMCSQYNTNRNTFFYRKKNGWTPQEALLGIAPDCHDCKVKEAEISEFFDDEDTGVRYHHIFINDREDLWSHKDLLDYASVTN